jgi:hypothetical protein
MTWEGKQPCALVDQPPHAGDLHVLAHSSNVACEACSLDQFENELPGAIEGAVDIIIGFCDHYIWQECAEELLWKLAEAANAPERSRKRHEEALREHQRRWPLEPES